MKKGQYTKEQLDGLKKAKKVLSESLDQRSVNFEMSLKYTKVLDNLNEMIYIINKDISLNEIFNNDPMGLLSLD